MQLGHGEHLTYCTNVHAGETFQDLLGHLTGPVREVKRLFCPDEPFGVGLRISGEAARSLEVPGAVERLRAELDQLSVYCFTINGFPYGNFHTGRVKESVYLPDWSDPSRGRYTATLARLLATLLPESCEYGSISTVPGCFRPSASPEREDRIRAELLEQVALLWELRERTGRRIVLALEPEPHCMLETTSEAVTFIQSVMGKPDSLTWLARRIGAHSRAAEVALYDHLGVCLDACHSAVEFETPTDSVALLLEAGICIAKLQLSVAPRAPRLTPATLDALRRLNEETYLHQVVVRERERFARHLDVPDALLGAKSDQEWRVHYHVPIFREQFGALQTTRAELVELLALQRRAPFTQHLEVETYTWGILEDAPAPKSLPPLLADELRWAWTELRGGAPEPSASGSTDGATSP